MCSNEFHNELYGHIQRHIEAKKANGKFAEEKEIDAFLEAEGIPKTKTWIRTAKLQYPTTLPVYVRNSIHHPENASNTAFTDDELRDAIGHLIGVVEKINTPVP